jgi:thioredoxin-related protein
MQPVVADLKSKCSKNVDFVVINVDDSANQDVVRKYGITTIPRYVLLDSSGKVTLRWVGSRPASDFNSMQRYCAAQ